MTIHVETAGTLPALIEKSQKNSITELTLTGNLNGTDIRYIREMAGCDKFIRPTNGKLAVLDLTGATIVSGGDYYAHYGKDLSYLYSKDNTLTDQMFARCSRLISISLPDTAVEFDYSAVSFCLGLKQFVVSEQNTIFSAIDGVLFSKDQKTLLCFPKGRTGSYIVPDGVTNIGNSAFSDCVLQEIELPNSVSDIEEYAFHSCLKLKNIVLPDNLIEFGPFNIDKCPELTSVTIGESLNYIFSSVFYVCKKLKKFIVSEHNESFSVEDGVLYNKYKTTLVRYPSAKKNSVFHIPYGVKTIDENAFDYCLNLRKVTIPESVDFFGDFSFCDFLEMIYIKKAIPFDDNGEEIDWYKRLSQLSYVDIMRCKLYVPKGSSLIYRKADSFSRFEFIIETTEKDMPTEIDDSCILRYTLSDSGRVKILDNTVSFQLYDIRGKKVKPSAFSSIIFKKDALGLGAYAIIKTGNHIINQRIIYKDPDCPF